MGSFEQIPQETINFIIALLIGCVILVIVACITSYLVDKE